jgi:hypothetical protein
VQLVLYGHAFDVRELQVLLQTGGQRGLGHAASRAGLASGPFVFLLRAETPATSKLGGTIRREKVVFIKVQLRAVQPHAGTREGGLNTHTRREKVFSRCSYAQSNPHARGRTQHTHQTREGGVYQGAVTRSPTR